MGQVTNVKCVCHVSWTLAETNLAETITPFENLEKY